MSCFRTLALVAAFAISSATSFAHDDQHKAHQPAGTASATVRVPATGNPAGMPDIAMMDKHVKLMHEGMSMLCGMPPAESRSEAADPATRHRVLERRVDMMASIMQMLVDGMPTPPAASSK